LKGGAGSGNFGHAGRLGKKGGSAPKGKLIGPFFEGGSVILRNPTSKKEIISFLDKQSSRITTGDKWDKSAFYVDPRSGEINISSQQDHLPLARTLVRERSGKGLWDSTEDATKIDDSSIHGYLIQDRGKVTLVFRRSGGRTWKKRI